MSDTIMELNKNKEQYVYVMSNPSFPEDILKIGWTRDHPNIRANNLHTSGIPTPFIVEFVITTLEGAKLERYIHNHIKNHRVKSNREFFKISKDELCEKLVNELMLELKSITEINMPITLTKKSNKKVTELKMLYEALKKDADEFFDKFKKEKSELNVKEMNNKKYVTIIPIDTEYDITPLYRHGFENNDERRIKNVYYFYSRDIIQYKKWLDNLIDNYEEIKNRIGIKKLSQDNKCMKEWFLDTHKELTNLKNEYIWEL